MLENIRADLRHARKVNISRSWWGQNFKILIQPATIAVMNYRLSRWARVVRIPLLGQLLRFAAAVIRYVIEVMTGVHISTAADIGPGFVVHTPYGVFVGPAKIGKNCVVQHGVAITYGVKQIGDDVYFGPGAKVIGPTTIGNNVVVVANSLVMTDVPDNMTVVGVPARIRLPRGRTLRFSETAKPETDAGREPESVGKERE